MFQENRAKRSPMQIVGIVIIFILAILIILTFVIFGMFKDSGSAPKLFGYRVYVVDNDRMEPRIPKGSAVFVEEGTLPDPTKKSVILCRIDDQLWVIGFVGTQVTESGETSYLVKYDNATDDKTWGIGAEDIIGVATTKDRFIGGVIRFASSKLGMMVIVIVPCLLVVIYEVVMLIIGSRRNASVHEGGSRSSKKPKKIKDKTKPESVAENVIRKIGGGPDPEDIPPEREDIQIPIDTVKEEKYVEKQLRKANDKLADTVREETGVIETEEITLGEIRVEPESVIRRTEFLREAAHDLEPLKTEAEIMSQNIQTVPVPEELSGNPETEKPVQKPSEAEKSVLNDLSAARIDELIRLLEEEKKRLEGK